LIDFAILDFVVVVNLSYAYLVTSKS